MAERSQQQTQNRFFSDFLDISNDAIEVIDPATMRFLDVNKTACRELGYSREELLSMSVGDIDPNFASTDMNLLEEQIKISGFAMFDTVHRRMDGSTFPVEVSLRFVESELPYIISTCRDITARKQAEQKLNKLNRSLQDLRRVNQTLIYSADEEILCKGVCDILVESGDYCFAWIGYAEHDEHKAVRPVAWSGNNSGYLDEIRISWNDDEYGRGPTGTAIRTSLPVVVNDIAAFSHYIPWREQAGDRGYRSSMSLPLYGGRGCIGALNIYSSEQDAFDTEAQDLLMEMAGDLAFGIANLRHRSMAVSRENQMHALIEYNPDAIFILDAEGCIRFVNPAAEVLLGRSATELKGTPLGLPMTMGETTEIEILSYSNDGSYEPRIAEMRLVDISSAKGVKTLAFLHDITASKKAEQLSTRMGRILEHSWNEIYVFSTDTLKFVDVSVGAQMHLGYTLDELRQMTPMNIRPEFNREQCEILIEPLREGVEQEIHFESEQRRKDGSLYPVEVRLQLSQEEFPPVFIAIVQDITERRRYIAELEYRAMYDVLTNLPNRTLLHDRLDQSLKSVYRETESLAVLSMTILRISEINDLMGYQNGDRVLIEASTRLLNICRESDTMARLGDNEFVIILESATLESAQQIAMKIQKTLELPIVIDELSLEIEAAIGIALYPEHGGDTKTLLQHADIAMRLAKHESLGVSVYSHENVPFSLKRLKLHGELRQAIENNEMAVFYQPKVDVKTARIMGVEALARWPHPQEGMISPADFIPMVEQSGLIRPFTRWVLETAIVQLHHWREEGVDLSIAVNLSTRNLLDPELPGIIIELLETHQVSAHNLCLEITESALMTRPEQALKILNELHDIGAKLSIDDFGTGYSSLAYLKKLPVDELKIDQSFIFGLKESEDDAVIVRSTIELAHNLGLRTVAEGVETKDALDILEILNCDIIQGYYMSRPLPATELHLWLYHSQWGIEGSIKQH